MIDVLLGQTVVLGNNRRTFTMTRNHTHHVVQGYTRPRHCCYRISQTIRPRQITPHQLSANDMTLVATTRWEYLMTKSTLVLLRRKLIPWYVEHHVSFGKKRIPSKGGESGRAPRARDRQVAQSWNETHADPADGEGILREVLVFELRH